MLTNCSDDPDFAIQGLSRFALIYYLVTSGSLKTGATVISICNPGQTLPTLEVNDLSLKKVQAGRTKLFLTQSARDSCVVDASFLVDLLSVSYVASLTRLGIYRAIPGVPISPHVPRCGII